MDGLKEISREIAQIMKLMFENSINEVYTFTNDSMASFDLAENNLKNAKLDPKSIRDLYRYQFEEDFDFLEDPYADIYDEYKDEFNEQKIKDYNEIILKEVTNIWNERCLHIKEIISSRANRLSKMYYDAGKLSGQAAINAGDDVISYAKILEDKFDEVIGNNISNLNEILSNSLKNNNNSTDKIEPETSESKTDIIQQEFSKSQEQKERDIELCYKVISAVKRQAEHMKIYSERLNNAILEFEQKIEQVRLDSRKYTGVLKQELNLFDRIWTSEAHKNIAERKKTPKLVDKAVLSKSEGPQTQSEESSDKLKQKHQEIANVLRQVVERKKNDSQIIEDYKERKKSFDELSTFHGLQTTHRKKSETIDTDIDGFELQEKMILNAEYLTDEQKKSMINELYKSFDEYTSANPEKKIDSYKKYPQIIYKKAKNHHC